jgi:hypothetical protein
MLRGRRMGWENDEERCCRRLLIAIILQAVRDAQRGDMEAASWLAEIGPLFAGRLGMTEDAFMGWQTVRFARVDRDKRGDRRRGLLDDGEEAERNRLRWRVNGARTRERKRAAKLAELAAEAVG